MRDDCLKRKRRSMASETKNILVLDNGLWEMKVGFAGDEAPRYLQRSLVGFPKNPAITVSSGHPEIYIGNEVQPHADVLDIRRPLQGTDKIEWSVLEKCWRALFYNEVKSKLDDFPLLITCSSHFDTKHKMRVAELFFENFDFPALNFQLSNVTGLYAQGRTTGLVLDSGFSRTTAVPVFEGYPIEERQLEIKFGGNSVNQTFRSLLQSSIDSQKESFETQSDFFRFYGYNFNELYYEQNRVKSYFSGSDGLKLTLPDGNLVTVNQLAINSFINESATRLSNAIVSASKLCEDKYRSEMLQNFCLIGGNTLIPGLERQILAQLTSDGLKDIVLNERTDEEKRYAAWTGGSLFASLDCFNELLVRRFEYEESGADGLIKRNLL